MFEQNIEANIFTEKLGQILLSLTRQVSKKWKDTKLLQSPSTTKSQLVPALSVQPPAAPLANIQATAAQNLGSCFTYADTGLPC